MFVPPSPLPPTPSGFFPHKSVGSSLAKVTMTRGAQRRVCLLVRPPVALGAPTPRWNCLLHPALRQHSALLPLHGPLFLCLPALSSRPPSLGTLVNEGGLASGLLPPQPRGGKRFLRTDFSLRSSFFGRRGQKLESSLTFPQPGTSPPAHPATFPFSRVQTPAPLRSHRHSCSSSGLSHSLLIISASTGSPCSLSTQKPASTF